MRKILFLSALDFKEKSIQVIRKTPEAYARRGWEVKYLVARNTCTQGNYFYENIIDPPGVDVVRFHWPFAWLRDRVGRKARILLNKLAGWMLIWQLAWKGFWEVRKSGPYQVIYGYECHGTLAAALVCLALKITWYRRPIRYVSRFQGTVLQWSVENGNYLELVKKFDFVLANYLPFDLCIMTNDGTRGLEFLKWIRSRNRNIRFYVNGVDPPRSFHGQGPDWNKLGVADHDTVILCLSRLVSWKRLDRAIRTMAQIIATSPSDADSDPVKLVIVGDGAHRENYARLADQLDIASHVIFVGPIAHDQVSACYKRADYFFSFYELTNVGNPLLEAIRHHKIIFTLNNGDTGQWIQNGKNGFLFEVDDSSLPERIAATFWRIHTDPVQRAAIVNSVKATESEKLWSWEERMTAEVESVEALYAA